MKIIDAILNKIRKIKEKDVVHYNGLVVAYSSFDYGKRPSDFYLSDLFKEQPKEFRGVIYFDNSAIVDDILLAFKSGKTYCDRVYVYAITFHITDEYLEKPDVAQVNMTNGYLRESIDHNEKRFVFSTKYTRSTVKIDTFEAIPVSDMDLIARYTKPGIKCTTDMWEAFVIGYQKWLNVKCREKYFEKFAKIPDVKIEFFEMAERKIGLSTLISIYDYHHTPPLKEGYTKRFIQDVMTTCATSTR